MNTSKRVPIFFTTLLLSLFAVATVISIRSVQAQVKCNETGHHLIKVRKVQGSNQLVDCELPTASKKNKHKITWEASGNDTITIEFTKNGNPFLNFTCQDQKRCVGEIHPNAEYRQHDYKVTLKSGGQVYTEDPGVIIQD